MSHTLLLADDSVTIQRVIELTFADEDVRVVAVSDGDQAIAVLNQAPPDIVLADVGMPGPNGYEVAQYMKDTPRLAHIPVMLLTGAFEPIDHARATEVGCDGVLAKPFEPQLVISRVKELLAKPKQVAASLDRPSRGPSAPWTIPDEPAKPRGTPEPAEIETYFDRLNQAFEHLPGAAQSKPPKPSPGSLAKEIDWFSPQAAAGPTSAPIADLPLSYTRPAFSPPPPLPAPPESASPQPLTLPPLADVFAALLAAEQSAPPPQAAPSWPASPPAPAISEDLIEEVASRVLARMSDRAIRETVADTVLVVAERLVREEIERIKSTIK